MASHASEPASDPWLPRRWIVRETVRDTHDVATLLLEPEGDSSAERGLPGQFNMLYAFGIGEVPISISAADPGTGTIAHTIREVGAVTRALCAVAPGGWVGLRGPFGSHWPLERFRGRDVVLAAGGIGLAPLRPVIRAIQERREEYDDVVVLYGTRSPADLLYSGEFDEWRDAGIQVEVTVDRSEGDWEGHVGVVTTLIRHARFDVDEAVAFVCGPEVMMRFMAGELEERGVAADRLFLSMERNMKCALGFCGHCQFGPEFICLDGPVFDWPRLCDLITIREL